MWRLGWQVLVGLLVGQAAFAATAIDTAAVAKANFTEIKQLKQENRSLLGDIEQLQEQQKYNQQKIAELFRLLEYKATNTATKAVVSKLKHEDRVAKKAYTNARNLLLTDQYDQAINAFLNYLKHYPDNNQISDVYYWLGKAYVAKGDYQNGKKIFTDFQSDYSLHAKFPNSLYELAFAHYQLKENKVALALLQTMIKKFPNHSVTAHAKDLLLSIEPQTTDNKTNTK